MTQPRSEASPRRLLTAPEVASVIGAHPSTVYEWASKGRIPHLRIGHLVRFDRDDIEAWLASSRREVEVGA